MLQVVGFGLSYLKHFQNSAKMIRASVYGFEPEVKFSATELHMCSANETVKYCLTFVSSNIYTGALYRSLLVSYFVWPSCARCPIAQHHTIKDCMNRVTH